jgi:putative NIF3 family GTP cyclohydrolase 1 type 2
MIDDPKKEEDLNEEIEVEIDEEGHTESPSEEQPAPEPETPETEKEEEVEDKPEEEEDSTELEPESEEEESDDKKVYGKRAEKRIKRLVKQRKELQEKLEALEAEKQKFQEEREELAGRTAESELEAVKQYGNRLKAQEKEILATLKDAKAQGDVDREIEATDKLASVKAEALIVKQYEQRAGRTSTTKKVSAEETAKKLEEKVAVPDRRAVQWQKRNSWFGGNDQSQKIMTQAAMVIHKELIEEGVYPDADPDEYYSELDARIRNEFPEKFKAEKSAKKVQVVAGGTRTSPSGKQKVTLTKSEVETANKLGVSLQEYAKQKMRRDQAAG